ncbi:MAG: hypothetical protein IJQ02_11825 [Oscillospiraceae bacterium]|nr:hypothetical protein [Oscillospiraceae bacterium]
MNDIENELYTPIAQALREEFPGISVAGEYAGSPAGLPHVSLVEADSYVTPGSVDSSGEEKLTTLLYEVNVYSGKVSGKRSECKRILDLVDRMMMERNFRRTAKLTVPNLENTGICRMVARYRGETDGRNLYRK